MVYSDLNLYTNKIPLAVELILHDVFFVLIEYRYEIYNLYAMYFEYSTVLSRYNRTIQDVYVVPCTYS